MSFKNNLNKYLRKFNVELHGLGYLQSLAKGDFKKDESDLYKLLFKEKDITIYDVGANRGVTIQSFKDLFAGAKIHAFEPYEALALQLAEKYGSDANVFINQCGISDMPGTVSFNMNYSPDTSSLLASKKTGLNSDKQVETIAQTNVIVTTVDEYAKKKGHDQINILKLDIQGSELNALKGAARMLSEKRIDLVFTEAYFVQQYEGQPLFHEIAGFLLGLEYELQDIYHPLYGKGKIAWCDALFVRNNLRLT